MDQLKDCNYFQFLYHVGLFPRFIFWFKRDIKKKKFYTSIETIFTTYCCPIFQVVRTKELNKKANPTASKMKHFMTLVDGLFGKQLNNVTKNPISDDPRSISLLSILKKHV